MFRPAFDQDALKAVLDQLKAMSPDGKIVMIEPVMSELEVLGLGIDKAVTAPLTSNALLSNTSISVDIPDGLGKFCSIAGRTTQARLWCAINLQSKALSLTKQYFACDDEMV